MKRLRAFVVGLLIGAALGLWFGYNHGRDAPLLTNPFAEHTAVDEVKQRVQDTYEEGKEAVEQRFDDTQ